MNCKAVSLRKSIHGLAGVIMLQLRVFKKLANREDKYRNMKTFIKRHLITALMETVTLLAGTILVYLFMTYLIRYESRYDVYRENGTEQTVTIASALDIVEDGEIAAEEDIAGFAKTVFLKTGIVAPETLLNFYNKEISYRTAKLIPYCMLGAIVGGFICFAAGIGLPFRWRRHTALMDKFDEICSVDKDSPRHYDRYLNDWVRDGEMLSRFLWGTVSFLLLFVAGIWGGLLPLIIVLNVVIAIAAIIIRLVKFVILNIREKEQRKKREKQTEKKTCTLVVDGSYFRVEQDQNKDVGLYLRQYWNAVIAKRIMVLELKGRGGAFSGDDAKNYILYGNEEVHDRYEFNRHWQKIKTCFDKERRIKEKQIEQGEYRPVFPVTDGQDVHSLALFLGDSCMDGTTVTIQNEKNFSLLCAVLQFDKRGETFEMGDWDRLKPGK